MVFLFFHCLFLSSLPSVGSCVCFVCVVCFLAAEQSVESNRSDGSLNCVGRGDIPQRSRHSEASDNQNTPTDLKEVLDLDLGVEEDPDDGDSFFDDPLPKPQKTYGW